VNVVPELELEDSN